MATNLNISENQERVPLTIGSRGVLRSITPDNGSPYYVGARAYVTQTASGATVTVIDKEGTTTAVILNGTNGINGQDGADGADGNGIVSIDLTSTVGNVDTYTITYDDGSTDTFDVTNGVDGQDGADGADGADGQDGFSPIATVTKSGDTATITITDKNGTTTATVQDGTQANAFTAEFGTTTYADVKDAYDDDAILICTVDDSGNTVVLQLVYFDATNEIFYFAEPNGDGWYWTELSNANGWDDGTRYLASTDVATQLADGLMSALDKQKLDGLSKRNIWYGTCSTSASSSPKSITTASGDFSLTAGNMLCVLFSHTNSLSSVSLQVDGGTSKSAYSMDGTSDISNRWGSNEVVMFVYDGTKFVMLEQGLASTTQYGITKLNNTVTSTSTSEAATANAVKTAYDNGGVQSVNGSTGAVSLSIHNVPSGGSSGQVLSKASGTDYDLAWVNQSGGGGTVTDVEVDNVSVVTGGVAEIDLTGKSDVGHTHTMSAITDFSPNVVYCTCSTAAGTAAKAATIESGTFTSLNKGDQAIVKFTNANSASSPTLQVGTTTAKSIKRYGTTAPSTSAATSWNAGSAVLFVYDGTYWQQIGFLNTTYSEISSSNITDGTSSGTGLITGRRAKAAVEKFAPVKDVTVGGTSVLSGTTAVVPAIPTVNDATLTIQKNGVDVQTFTANASSNVTANITVPTDTGDLTNGAGFITGGTPIPTADTVAEFDGDAHINSEDMSAQDVEDFVDNLDAQGANLGDYVVEQGTSGLWTYRKWNSGIAECWYSDSFTVNFDTQAVGNLRTSSTTNSVTMPSVLTSVTEYNVSGYNTGSTGWATLVTGAISGSSIILSYMGWTSSGNKTVVANIYILGRWK